MDTRPVGVFDSGLGGLTAVRQLTACMPEERIVYFGDTGRVPYGSRSRGTIRRYARQDAAFLLSQDVKMIVAVSSPVPREISCSIWETTEGSLRRSCPALNSFL